MKIDRVILTKQTLVFLKYFWPPIVLFLIWFLVCCFTGGSVSVYPQWWQFLPEEALLAEPFESLFFLHGQPPVLNFLFWLILLLENITGIGREFFASCIMNSFSLALCLVWYRIGLLLTHSKVASAIFVFLIISNPMFTTQGEVFFYSQMIPVMIGCLILSLKYLIREDAKFAFIPAALVAVTIVHTRSLWHPLFFVCLFATVGLFCHFLGGKKYVLKRCFFCGLLFISCILPWATKNKVLFNSFGFSSWVGLNIWGANSNPFIINREYNEDLVLSYYSSTQLERFEDVEVVSMIAKNIDPEIVGNDLVVNLNHYAVPALSAADVKVFFVHHKLYPNDIPTRFLYHLKCLDLPGYGHFNEVDRTGEWNMYGHWYLNLHNHFIHGSWMRHLLGYEEGTAWRPSFFILSSVFLLGWFLFQCWNKRNEDEGIYYLAMIAMTIWLYTMVIVIDGREGNRMRWEIQPIYLLFATIFIQQVTQKISIKMKLSS